MAPAGHEDPDASSEETRFSPRPSSESSRGSLASSPSAGRFLPGTILAGRYRIFGLVGRGGMGEVYRADDIKLGQSVALKFLPEAVARDETRLGRLLAEVRIARQISHPSVCRVYDVAEADGHHFISMEFVDGEDLASLLRRIGRLPQDKAIQIARQLCAGLAAAHEQGVLHRDLKPANVMIDGRGRARITDFGLASAEGDHAHAGAGTPAYMAPEQLAGRPASLRSDLYALGLVLYEVFTGKPAWDASSAAELARLHQKSSPSVPSAHVPNLDKAVERAILRCLEREPGERPSSALAVAAALPGGDPLAEALAAGETPSPEMVAAAGESGGLKPWVASVLFLTFLVGFIASLPMVTMTTPIWSIPHDKPPEALEAEARDILETVGHATLRADSWRGFAWDNDHYQDVTRNGTGADRWKVFAASRPSPLQFCYRESPRLLVPFGRRSVDWNDPPLRFSGEARVWLDPKGRLLGLAIVPPQHEEGVTEPTAGAAGPDWAPVFAAAGFDLGKFTAALPTWTPPVSCDARLAWTGECADRPGVPIRVEAGSWRGKPVWFDIIAPWTKPTLQEEWPRTLADRVLPTLFFSLLGLILVAAIVLARRNLRLGRGDRRGAFRVAMFLFAIYLASSLTSAHHVADWDELTLLGDALSQSLYLAALVWLVYLALEPYVRKLWPELLISWSRLIAGRYRDPRVGRDILVGGVVGGVLSIPFSLSQLLPGWLGREPEAPLLANLSLLNGFGPTVSQFLLGVDLLFPVFLLFVLLLARMALRNEWLAIGAIMVLWSTIVMVQGVHPLIRVAFAVPVLLGIVFLLIRFGLLALIASFFLSGSPASFAPNSLSSWYLGPALLYPVTAIALAAFAFHTSLGGRPLFGGDLLAEPAGEKAGRD